uniref:Response regulatory domain-containing protein n=1 Tax=Salix viminalis TaxID=40686 RepID=A0A6N2KSA8_SALVM
MLRDVPSLKKLMALKRLDLFQTELETMPQGMECLTNLRCLRMNACFEMEFPSGVLPKLSRLQVLALDMCLITVKVKEVGSLRNLETLECNFEGLSDFVEYLRSPNGIRSLSTCKISVGSIDRFDWEYVDCFPSKTVLLGYLSINRDIDFPVKFLNGIQGLYCECIDARSLCDVLSLENATELEIIHIESCDSMESLVSSSWFCSAPPPLPSHNGIFSRLKKFHCDGCSSMEKLFPLELLSYLVNLEVIVVTDCERMEEIIGTTDEESSTSNPITELTLPKLKTLQLSGLPELKRICSGKLICNSLEVIYVRYCEKLKRIPIRRNSAEAKEGLGFIMCKRLVQMMQGNIWISLNPLGCAQSMTLVLRFQIRPSYGRATFAPGSSSEQPSSNPQFRGLRVILADDDALNRTVTKKLLEKLGCEITL